MITLVDFPCSFLLSQVTANGVISLDDMFSEYAPMQFPYTSGNIIICPFWADLDSTLAGTISHNNGTLNTSIAIRVKQLIRENFGYNFSPSGIFISTWDGLPHHEARATEDPGLLSIVSAQTSNFQ